MGILVRICRSYLEYLHHVLLCLCWHKGRTIGESTQACGSLIGERSWLESAMRKDHLLRQSDVVKIVLTRVLHALRAILRLRAEILQAKVRVRCEVDALLQRDVLHA